MIDRSIRCDFQSYKSSLCDFFICDFKFSKCYYHLYTFDIPMPNFFYVQIHQCRSLKTLDRFFIRVLSIPFLSFSNIVSPLYIIMMTLLDSCKQHLRSRTLSRKAHKAEVLNGEPSNRRLPVICRDTCEPQILDERPYDALQPILCPGSVPLIVSTEQQTKRQRVETCGQQIENELRTVEPFNDNIHDSANICPSNVLADSSVMDKFLIRSSTHFRRQQAQRLCRDRERRQKAEG